MVKQLLLPSKLKYASAVEVFKGIEHYCTVPDYKIMRFLTETKLRMKGIDENKVLDQ